MQHQPFKPLKVDRRLTYRLDHGPSISLAYKKRHFFRITGNNIPHAFIYDKNFAIVMRNQDREWLQDRIRLTNAPFPTRNPAPDSGWRLFFHEATDKAITVLARVDSKRLTEEIDCIDRTSAWSAKRDLDRLLADRPPNRWPIHEYDEAYIIGFHERPVDGRSIDDLRRESYINNLPAQEREICLKKRKCRGSEIDRMVKHHVECPLDEYNSLALLRVFEGEISKDQLPANVERRRRKASQRQCATNDQPASQPLTHQPFSDKESSDSELPERTGQFIIALPTDHEPADREPHEVSIWDHYFGR